MLNALTFRARVGVTLLELIVTLVIGGLALSLIAAISVRQGRIASDLTDGAALAAQISDAASVLPVDLRSVSSAAGDIVVARDTALEIRATIGSAVVCDTSESSFVLAPAVEGADTYASFLSSVAAGDTIWILSLDDRHESWRSYRVDAVGVAAAGQCSPPGPVLTGAALDHSRVMLRSDSLSPITVLGAPVRITRPLRYSLYRGSDGSWYLGQRDWNTTSLRFNTIQPVAGPFLPAPQGLVFKYVDTVGVPLATPVVDTRAIAMIRIDLRGATRGVVRMAGPHQRRVDSSSVWLLLRNRR